MITTTNMLNVPQIRNYHRAVVDGWLVISYEQRHPGAVAWEPIEIVVPPQVAQERRSSASAARSGPLGGTKGVHPFPVL